MVVEAPPLPLNTVTRVSITTLRAADSPRLAGVNGDHVCALVEVGTELPPIIVHRSTMRVVDGVHRVQAVLLRGDTEIAVRFFHGTEQEAFVFAVEQNGAHGLPLSTADRSAAAARILQSHPHWSDRTIAEAAGISAKSVGALRGRDVGPDTGAGMRIGKDGKVRPVDPAAGRIRVSELIADNPDASLRKIAHQAGVSAGTVRAVRDRLRRGEDPAERRTPRRQIPGGDRGVLLAKLAADPTLRLTDGGRRLLGLLTAHSIPVDHREQLVRSVPAHAASMVSEVARACARAWTEFADQLERE
jgi:ParB-like chromosome segregation protein Spo0J